MRSVFAKLRRTNPDILFYDAKGRFYWKSITSSLPQEEKESQYNVYMTRRTVDPKKHESEVIHNDDLVFFFWIID